MDHLKLDYADYVFIGLIKNVNSYGIARSVCLLVQRRYVCVCSWGSKCDVVPGELSLMTIL